MPSVFARFERFIQRSRRLNRTFTQREYHGNRKEEKNPVCAFSLPCKQPQANTVFSCDQPCTDRVFTYTAAQHERKEAADRSVRRLLAFSLLRIDQVPT